MWIWRLREVERLAQITGREQGRGKTGWSPDLFDLGVPAEPQGQAISSLAPFLFLVLGLTGCSGQADLLSLPLEQACLNSPSKTI